MSDPEGWVGVGTLRNDGDEGGTGLLAPSCLWTQTFLSVLFCGPSASGLPRLDPLTPLNAPDPADITLALLAGGQGRRMGRPKASLQIHGRPVLDYLADRLAWPGPTLLVTAPGVEHPPGWGRFTAEVTDPVAGLGPLRGVLTALEHGRSPVLLVTTVDMPAIRSGHLIWLAAALVECPDLSGLALTRPTPAGPGSQIEPFPCALTAGAREAVAAHLAEGRRSVHSLFARGGFATVPAPESWPPAVWTNLNHPSDLQAYLDSRDSAPEP